MIKYDTENGQKQERATERERSQGTLKPQHVRKRDRTFGNPVEKCGRDGLLQWQMEVCSTSQGPANVLECQMEVCPTSQGPANVLECHMEVCSTSQGPANVLECHMEVCSTSQGPANERDL